MKRHPALSLLSFLSLAVLLANPPGYPAQEKPSGKPDPATVETGKILKRTYAFKEAAKDMEYALFVPKGYDGKKPYPLVVALHGLGATPQVILRYPGLMEQAQKHGYIVVAPMGYNSSGWYGSKGQKSSKWQPENLGELSEKDVLNVVDLVGKELAVDSNRVYLMGHSMGGGGTFYLGIKYAERWAGLAAVAPAIFSSPSELKNIKDTPIILVQGEKDKLVPVTLARKWADKMKELGMTHQYIEVMGGDHISPAFQKLPDIFEFFNKNQKKTEKPK